MRKKVWTIAGFALLFLCALTAAEQLEITDDVRMRVEPDNSAGDIVGIVPKGSMVPIIDRQDKWYKIAYKDTTGWIFGKFARQRVNAGEIFSKQDVSMLPPVPTGDDGKAAELSVRITLDNTPILEHLGADAPVLHTAQKGESFTLIGKGSAWCKIVYKDTSGWIKMANVEISDSAGPSKKYARVLQDNTLIRYYLDPQAPYLYKARKGDWFVLVNVGVSGTWCKVAYNDTSGWVKMTDVEILDSEPTKAGIVVEEAKALFFGLLGLGVVILIISVIVTLRHIKAERMRNVYVQKNALILAKESKHVQDTLTNTTKTMEHCLVGFNVSVAKDSVTARANIENSMPDLILVDWDFETAIFAKIDNLFARITPPTMPHFLFYNVPDPTAVPPCKALRNVNLLGISVSDRDIIKVATPLLVHHSEADQSVKDIQKGVQRCALEGEIAGGNLLEVLQFIEIGSKTGCLQVETREPFGVVYFNDGRIIYAEAKGVGQHIYGVEGVYEILNQPAGKFRFITNKQPKAANLNLPTLSVLMEWTKEKDESHKSL